MRSIMKKIIILCIVAAFMLVLLGSVAEAAVWKYHPRYVNGWLTVWGTINCQVTDPPLFDRGYVVVCNHYAGFLHPKYNDYLTKFEWDASCGNVDWEKTTLPWYDGSKWRLLPLADWIETTLPPGTEIVLPCIGDSTGTIQEVYVVVDLAAWYADPRALQDTYTVVDGESPDLPGYLIGTTPIVFDSLASPAGSPFSTTLLTGELYLDGDITFDPTIIPTLSHWGLIVLAVLVLGTAVFLIRRKRVRA